MRTVYDFRRPNEILALSLVPGARDGRPNGVGTGREATARRILRDSRPKQLSFTSYRNSNFTKATV